MGSKSGTWQKKSVQRGKVNWRKSLGMTQRFGVAAAPSLDRDKINDGRIRPVFGRQLRCYGSVVRGMTAKKLSERRAFFASIGVQV